MIIPNLTVSDLMRFWDKVDRGSENECWNWVGCKTKYGYGSFRIGHKIYYAHRVSYFIEYNIDPEDSMVCHECSNPPCINPNHLFLGNNSINIKQAYEESGRSNKGILHPNSKLHESDVREIRNLQGKLQAHKVAKIFYVSSSTIQSIWRYENWSHL